MSAAAVNLAALQRMDPNVLKIVGDGSSFVTVYERKGAEWVRKDVEGSLFIVQRLAAAFVCPFSRALLGLAVSCPLFSM
jgi:hypothetical protein